LGIGIAAVLQTYAWEDSSLWLAQAGDNIGRLDTLDRQLRDAESLNDSPLQVEQWRGSIAAAKRIAADSRAADSRKDTQTETSSLPAMIAELSTTAYARGDLSSRLHSAIRAITDRQRRLIVDRLGAQRSITQLARLLLELTAALSIFLIGLIAWQSSGYAHRAIAAREEQYRQAIELAGDIVCRTDGLGRFTFCNRTALGMLHFI